MTQWKPAHVMLEGKDEEHEDRRRHQMLDRQAQERAGSGHHLGQADGGGGELSI